MPRPAGYGKPITELDLQIHRERGARERAGVNGWEAGPITESTSADEIRKRAARLAHTHGVPVAVFETTLRLEQRLIILTGAVQSLAATAAELQTRIEEKTGLPHLRKVEKR